MKLHYQGKYSGNPETLPHGEHIPGAVRFREAADSKQMALIANGIALLLLILFAVPAVLRCIPYCSPQTFWQIRAGCIAALVSAVPHELLHALCFREDVYLYHNLKQGMLFVIGPEIMSKRRFIFLSLFPNIVFGLIPYLLALFFPRFLFCASLGVLSLSMGAGDYYNVFHALTQMPRGSKTYLYQFNSYWYLP